MAKKILITGGAGYIGSHTALELLNEGYEVVVYDNLCNSSKESLKRVEELTGKHITFYEGDVMDEAALKEMFEKENVDAVIHCAALKAVGESVQKPLEYYRNNITGTLTLMDVMKQTGVKNIVFSSSATVYGSPEEMPITEECPKGQCTNPYGWTKSMMEQIMTDVQKANPDMNVILLRYFNPVGAHESGRIGEDPKGIPNNLMRYKGDKELMLSDNMQNSIERWKRAYGQVTEKEIKKLEMEKALKKLLEDFFYVWNFRVLDTAFVREFLKHKNDDRYKRAMIVLIELMDKETKYFPELTKREANIWLIREIRDADEMIEINAYLGMLRNHLRRKEILGF